MEKKLIWVQIFGSLIWDLTASHNPKICTQGEYFQNIFSQRKIRNPLEIRHPLIVDLASLTMNGRNWNTGVIPGYANIVISGPIIANDAKSHSMVPPIRPVGHVWSVMSGFTGTSKSKYRQSSRLHTYSLHCNLISKPWEQICIIMDWTLARNNT